VVRIAVVGSFLSAMVVTAYFRGDSVRFHRTLLSLTPGDRYAVYGFDDDRSELRGHVVKSAFFLPSTPVYLTPHVSGPRGQIRSSRWTITYRRSVSVCNCARRSFDARTDSDCCPYLKVCSYTLVNHTGRLY